MANPDIPAALVVLETHLVAAGAALTDDLLDVDRGLLATRGRQLRYYWGGEVEPPRMAGPRVLNGEMVGERFIIAAAWPLTDLSEELVTAIDVEMQDLAGEIRTRIQADSTLGNHVTDLDLSYGSPDIVNIAGARHVLLSWDLDLAYVEYSLDTITMTLAAHVDPPTSTPEQIVNAINAATFPGSYPNPLTATPEQIVDALEAAGFILGVLDAATATAELICVALMAAGLMELV